MLLVGYQAAGTPGRALQEGAKTLRMFNQEITVRAHVVKLDGCSAHDQEELLRWLAGFTRPPRRTLCVHGEPQAADMFAAVVRHRLGWAAEVPEDRQCIELP